MGNVLLILFAYQSLYHQQLPLPFLKTTVSIPQRIFDDICTQTHACAAALIDFLIIIGTPKIYTTTGFGPGKNREMAGVDDLVVYMQTAVKYSSLYIHHQIVHTSNFPIFSRPKPGGGVYLWGPNITSLR